MSKRAVVMGGAGFVGSQICRGILDAGWSVTVLDRPDVPTHRLADVADRIELVFGDASDSDALLEILNGAEAAIDLVHTSVPVTSMSDPVADAVDNIVAKIGWLRRLNEISLGRLIYFSSGGAVYGVASGTEDIPEEHSTEPTCAYGVSKLAIEKYLLMYCRRYHIRPLIVRPSNIYGPLPQLDRPQGVIPTIVHRSLEKRTIEIVGDGNEVRDYIHVSDVVSAVVELLSYSGAESTFNLGSGCGYSVNCILDQLSRMVELPDIKHVPSRGFDVPCNVLDSSRLRRETGWRPQVTLKQGLKSLVASMIRGTSK